MFSRERNSKPVDRTGRAYAAQQVARALDKDLGRPNPVAYYEQADRRGELFVIPGACFSVWHVRRDGIASWYSMGVMPEHRGKGLARAMFAHKLAACRAAGATLVRIKCPVDCASNAYHRHMGFRLVRVEVTRTGRKVNVYERPI